jgi:hypothetical protein
MSGYNDHGIKAHPDYSEGYFDALEGCEPVPEPSPEYSRGYEAGKRAVAIFESNGFVRKDGGFSITLQAEGDS